MTEEYVKAADPSGDPRRLSCEATTLRAVAHPGVVRLLRVEGDPVERLVLERLPGPSVSDLGPQPVEVTAGWAASVATTLADLHDIGYTHGALDGDRILFDQGGRPVLCGFGDGAFSGAAADVAVIAGLVLDRLPAHADRRLIRFLRRSATGRHPVPARTLARVLVERVPGARLPGVAAPEATAYPPRPRPRRLVRAGAVALAVLVMTSAAVAGGLGLASPSRPAMAAAGRALQHLGVRYRLQAAGVVRPGVAYGAWGCRPSRPAVLDPRSGAVWVFPAWPGPGRAVAAELVGQVPGAHAIGARPAGPGCEELIAFAGGRAIVVQPGAQP